MAELQLLGWACGHYRKQAGLAPRQLPTGFAGHCPEANAFAYGERQYPKPPYGKEPLKIFLPQPAHDFGFDAPTFLPPALGLPFANNFKRWSLAWLNRDVLHSGRSGEAEEKHESGDLVSTIKAHAERDDERSDRMPTAFKFDTPTAFEFDENDLDHDPLFSP
jgi:hypothetical protein